MRKILQERMTRILKDQNSERPETMTEDGDSLAVYTGLVN